MGSNSSNLSVQSSLVTDKPFNIVKYECDWTIKDFENSKEMFTNYEHTLLTVDQYDLKDNYEIIFYPKGYNERTADYLSIWLRKTSNNERLVTFTCEIQNFVKKTIKKLLSAECNVVGWPTFWKRCYVLNAFDDVLKDGNLTLKFSLLIYDDRYIAEDDIFDKKDEKSVIPELVENMKQLFCSKNVSDVDFHFDSVVISAHKAVLCARSPVFKAMFTSSLDKSNKNIIITDISQEAFQTMMLFIYSGKICQLDFEQQLELYYAADKYELLTLKRICSKKFSTNLNVDNVITVIELANRHHDKELEEICSNFIARNAESIRNRSDWLNLMRFRAELANSVFYLMQATPNVARKVINKN